MMVDEGLQMIAEGRRAASRLCRRHGLPEPAAAAEGRSIRQRHAGPLEKQADDLLDKVKEIKQKQAEAAEPKS